MEFDQENIVRGCTPLCLATKLRKLDDDDTDDDEDDDDEGNPNNVSYLKDNKPSLDDVSYLRNDKPWLGVKLPGVRVYLLEDLVTKNFEVYDRLVGVSKMSLDFYEKNHPGESYKFDSLKYAESRPIGGIQYKIAFLAKNLRGEDGGPLETFEARVNILGQIRRKVIECNKLVK
ncbi:unnamed protein product [Cuscuta epithymum]|uniref:Uncharacterized protein n=1 Tax=Cuscuta epithymum TaxID=186058 RepID=A0AAV0F6R2_9ASTE|nr:unnamed protein product [Cuscuta epithymum]